uniref:BACK domain-containing protein n=1 Tax=Glossina palpalis gambiensis TaxID=67801 RepID=A0A1B0C2Z4_9MUSC
MDFRILELIMDEHLSVKFEDNAYKVAINWVKNNVDERKISALDRMRIESLLRSDQQCKEFLIEALNYKLMPCERKCSLNSSQTAKIAKNRNGKFHVVFTGVCQPPHSYQQSQCSVYNITNSTISSISSMNESRSKHSLISLEHVLYSVGGSS